MQLECCRGLLSVFAFLSLLVVFVLMFFACFCCGLHWKNSTFSRCAALMSLLRGLGVYDIYGVPVLWRLLFFSLFVGCVLSFVFSVCSVYFLFVE